MLPHLICIPTYMNAIGFKSEGKKHFFSALTWFPC
jgi:hypothetical protein